jgi:hypothetical protein
MVNHSLGLTHIKTQEHFDNQYNDIQHNGTIRYYGMPLC